MSTDPTAEHIDSAHHITALRTESGWLHICQVCKEATFFQPPALPCPGPVVPASTLAASLPAEVMLAALVDRGWCATCLCPPLSCAGWLVLGNRKCCPDCSHAEVAP